MATDFSFHTVNSIKGRAKNAIAIGPFGSRMKSSCYVSQGIPVIRGKNLSSGRQLTGDFVHVTPEKADELAGCNVFEGDLVFPHRGSIGTVGIVPSEQRFVLSSSLMKLTCDPLRANPLYVYYFFRSRLGRHELLKNASQVGTPGIGQPLNSLKGIKLPLPNLDTQNSIARVLGTLDDKIELNRRMNQTLEAMAQAIFKSWFVDFDPVKAKAAAAATGKSATEIERAAMAAISGKSESELDDLPEANRESLAQTAALFPASFVDSELGEIPEGWTPTPFSDLCDINPRRKLARKSFATYLEMKSVPTTGPSPSGVIQREFKSGSKFQNGDTLLARITPCLENGKTAFVDFLEEGEVGWGSTEFIIIRPTKSLPLSLGYFFARSDGLRAHAIKSMTGTSGRQRVPSQCFDDYLVPIPPENALFHSIGALTDTILQITRANSDQSHTLAQLRDTLLPKLLSGELSVTGFQETTEEVTAL